ncbi:hypothetical protein Taro_000470 [Colocasia esculenta]|uniref:Uncharacterized protein n=1 Tax=Colocasia esculenta TaxID=4460 RepID=A0A843TF25_COLES|nr:hypothetical protein [Colocasia esculenta]
MNATYRVVVFLNATVTLSPSGPYQHLAMQSVRYPCTDIRLTLPLLDACFAREWSGSGAVVERRWHEMMMWRNEAK